MALCQLTRWPVREGDRGQQNGEQIEEIGRKGLVACESLPVSMFVCLRSASDHHSVFCLY